MGDQSTDDKDKGTKEKTIEINGKMFTAKQIQDGIKELNDDKVKAVTGLEVANRELEGFKAAPRKDDTKDDDKVDLEELSREDFASHLIERMSKEVVAPVAAKVVEGERNTAATNTKRDIKAVEGKYGDFWEYEDEVKVVLKENASMNIEDAYLLAKGKSPSKVESLAKAAEKRDAAKVEESNTFGGLLPTSGLTRKNSKMNQKDAADAAWEEHNVGAHLRSLTGE